MSSHSEKTDPRFVEKVDLSEVIRQTHEIIARVLNRNIEIVLNLDKDLFIKGNRSLLSQVFMNLYSNANDAMPNGGKLTVEAKRKGNKILAVVSDTGIGMDEKTVEKIFDPFFTLKEVGKGTGLGLSTVHGIVEEHKGTITVSSKPGKGAVFKIVMPYAEPKSSEKVEPAREIIPGKGERILIVDDERPALDALAAICKKLGYEAISVEKPLEALQNYNEWDPDVVLIGEMRDLETMEAALRIAETGHLTFATLHTNSAVQTMNRIIDAFPANQQSQVRAQLSFVLEGILCQTLLPKSSGKGRCLAMEILIPTPAIRNLIREDKLHQIYSMMQTGQNKYGMQTFNQALATLVHRRVIAQELAMTTSSLPDELSEMIARGAGLVGQQAPGAPAAGSAARRP